MPVTGPTTPRQVPGWLVPAAVFGLVSVCLYIGGWLVAGLLTEGFDPLRQAISETFDLGAPALPRAIATTGLVVSGFGLIVFGPVLHVGLPGTSRVGPVLATTSGVFSVLVGVFPCTDGCPGLGTTTTDTLHVAFAAVGYLTLILAPLAVGVRLRGHLQALARASLTMGALALLGFVLRNGVVEDLGGLQQRLFNTVADLWYVVVAVVVIRHALSVRTRAPSRGTGCPSGPPGR